MTALPAAYFDVGPALTGGFRVVYIRDQGLQEQLIIDTANDVACAAKLCAVSVMSSDPDVRAACRVRGVRTHEREVA